MDLLSHIIETTNDYIDKMPKSQRKKYGQFFTSKETAVFMARLFRFPEEKDVWHILDPGAGTGVLTAALIDRIQNETSVLRIILTCYENDKDIIGVLKENLNWICQHSSVLIDYQIKTDNYIVSQVFDYNSLIGANLTAEKYDLIIGNPPYMKIAKTAPEAKAMPDICYGAPNLYFLFTAMGIFNLKENGELVFIIPRSWTSGAYFKRFRQKLFNECALVHIHLFESRDKVFDKESVLQETIIIKIQKTTDLPKKICITKTQSNKDFSDLSTFFVSYDTVIFGKEKYVYLITDKKDEDTVNQVHIWQDTLPELGLAMKTGLTVDFRNSDCLRDSAGENAVPLFYSQHIKEGKVVFPIQKDGEYIETLQPGLLQNNANYLFVKRFTAKEEARRLQCGIYLSRSQPEYKKISTQNKINFIGGSIDLPESIFFGLYVLFNSTLYDDYYRILNGSTQVNSTEINTMPIPPYAEIKEMGEQLMTENDLSVQICDNILRRHIYDTKSRRIKEDIEGIADAG